MEEIDCISVEVELENGTTLLVNFMRKYSYICEPNYGADRDGNRAVVAWFLDEDEFNDVSVYAYKTYKDLCHFRKRNQERINIAIENWMDKNQPPVRE